MLVFPEIRPCGTLACCPHCRRPNPGSHGARRPAPFQCSPACGWFRRSRAGGSRRVGRPPEPPCGPSLLEMPGRLSCRVWQIRRTDRNVLRPLPTTTGSAASDSFHSVRLPRRQGVDSPRQRIGGDPAGGKLALAPLAFYAQGTGTHRYRRHRDIAADARRVTDASIRANAERSSIQHGATLTGLQLQGASKNAFRRSQSVRIGAT